MKNKIIYVWLVCFVLMNVLLGGYVIKQKLVCTHTHIEDIDRAKEVVPNEVAARRIAEVYIDSLEGVFGWDENVIYDVTITFDDRKYEWMVWYCEGGQWL